MEQASERPRAAITARTSQEGPRHASAAGQRLPSHGSAARRYGARASSGRSSSTQATTSARLSASTALRRNHSAATSSASDKRGQEHFPFNAASSRRLTRAFRIVALLTAVSCRLMWNVRDGIADPGRPAQAAPSPCRPRCSRRRNGRRARMAALCPWWHASGRHTQTKSVKRPLPKHSRTAPRPVARVRESDAA
jgi:hypothetical protein